MEKDNQKKKLFGVKLDQEYLDALREWALEDDRTVAWEIRQAIRVYGQSRYKSKAAEPTTFFYVGSSLTPEQREKVNAEPDRPERVEMIQAFLKQNASVNPPARVDPQSDEIQNFTWKPSSVVESAASGEGSANNRQDATSDPKEGLESES
jgi:hypothetical protein